MFDQGLASSGFIICGKSLKEQWAKKIYQFTGEHSYIIVDGTGPKRQKQYALYAEGRHRYLILNIEQVVNDWEIVSKLDRDFVAADEVQFAKNFAPRRSKRLKQLRATYKWGLTGQPVENRAEDLFSIMQWIDRSVLGKWPEFDSTFIHRAPWGKVLYYVNLPLLHKTIKPIIARAKWDDPEVSAEMPKVTNDLLYAEFDPEGARLYRKIRQDLLADLSELRPSTFDANAFYNGAGSKEDMRIKGQIMSKLMCLRMLCDHPELLKISAAHANSRVKRGGIRQGSEYAAELEKGGYFKRLSKTPKLDMIKEDLGPFLEEDIKNKVVIFSFFKDMLGILAKELGVGYVKFTGEMSTKQRGEAIERFEHDPDCRVFLSSDAGGEGIDLPFANRLINYDLPFSFGRFQQRNARIIRLSSHFAHVSVLSAIMTESIEERLYASLTQKGKIGSAILDGKGIDGNGQLSMDLVSLRSFLEEKEV